MHRFSLTLLHNNHYHSVKSFIAFFLQLFCVDYSFFSLYKFKTVDLRITRIDFNCPYNLNKLFLAFLLILVVQLKTYSKMNILMNCNYLWVLYRIGIVHTEKSVQLLIILYYKIDSFFYEDQLLVSNGLFYVKGNDFCCYFYKLFKNKQYKIQKRLINGYNHVLDLLNLN